MDEQENMISRLKFYEHIVQSMAEGVVAENAEGEFVFVNPAAAAMLGYAQDEMAGMHWTTIIPLDQYETVNQADQRRQRGESDRYELGLLSRDGDRVWVQVSARPIFHGGQFAGSLSVFTDIRDRKRAEEMLREVAQFDRQIIDSINEGIVVCDLDLCYIYWNAYMETISGMSESQVIGRHILEVFPFLEDQGVHFLLERALQGETVFTPDLPKYIPNSQQTGWITAQYKPLLNSKGEITGVLGAIYDVTRHKLIEDALQANEDRYRKISELTSDYALCIRVDPDGHAHIDWNTEAFARITGYTLEELLPQGGIFSIAHPDDVEAIAHIREKLVDEEGTATNEFRIITRLGEVRWLNNHGQSTRSADGTTRLYMAGQDITERKVAEEATKIQIARLAALRTIDTAITNTLDQSVTFKVVVGQTQQQLQVDAVAILLLNPYLQTLEYAAGRGFRGEMIQKIKVRLGEGVAGTAALDRRTIHIRDLASSNESPTRLAVFKSEEFNAYCVTPLVAKGQVHGVLEVFNRTPLEPDQEWYAFLETLAGQAAIAIDNMGLFDRMNKANTDLILAYDATIEGWTRALDMRDRETEGHTQRVTEITQRLGSALGVKDADLLHLRRGALLHDIGKMGVPDAILLKPGPLNEEEWAIMRKHPQYAFEMLAPIQYLNPALDIPYCHHEWWDGSGYPRGLQGETIPLAARIFSVVDVYDALTSDRPYRAAWTPEKTIEYITQQAGTHFDPDIVNEFLYLIAMD